MESVKIDYLVEKYFQEKPVLQKKRNYTTFSSSDVAQHLEQYRPIFEYFFLPKTALRPSTTTPKVETLMLHATCSVMFAGILEPMFYHNYMMQTNSLTD
jgi:hypothetical protein